MAVGLGVVLESAMKSPGVVAGVLVDSQGCVVESASGMGSDLAASGPVANQMLKQWSLAGTDLGIGTVQSMLIERSGSLAAITPMRQDMVLVVIANHACRPGRLRLQAKRARETMDEADRTEADPETAPAQPADQLHDLAAEIEADTAVTPPHLTTGEIVLVGLHNFRLIKNLIAQILQLKGVRSSRLRAYTPNSTIVDVVLEDGATLETIEGGCLEEFSIDRAEEGGTRLVLRAGKAVAIPPSSIGSPE